MFRRALVFATIVALLAGASALAFGATPQVAPPAFSDISGHQAEAELTIMAGLGIMSGDRGLGGPVRPDATITRAEFSKMVIGAMGKTTLANGLANMKPTFKDVTSIPQWAWGWVNAAAAAEIITGYDDGTFKAGNNVKYSEAIAMLVRAVPGHKLQVGTAQPWPFNYIAYAIDNGFTDDVDIYPEMPATRGDVARLLFAMMRVDKRKANGDPDPGTAYLAGRLFEGTLSAFSATSATIGTKTLDLADSYYLLGGASLDELRNLNVQGVASASGDWVVIRKVSASNVYSGTFNSLDTSGDPKLLVFAGGRQIPYTPPVDVTLNQEAGHNEGDLHAGDVCTVVVGGDGYAVSVTAMRDNAGPDYILAISPSSGSTPTHIKLQGGGAFDIPSSATVTLNGSASSRDSLAVNDVVYIATRGADTTHPVIRVTAIRQVVEGTVTNVVTNYPGPVWNVTINRTTGGTQTYILDHTYFAGPPSVGDHVKYGLDALGHAFVPIGVTMATTCGVLTGASDLGGGNYTATFDLRGVSQTIPATLSLALSINEYGDFHLNAAGKIDSVVWYSLTATDYVVVAVDTVNKRITVQAGASTYVSDEDPIVYRNDSGTKTYIGVAGVTVGMHLKADATRKVWEYTP